MKFKQMEYVLAVARAGSFTQAAKDMYVSQPNISSAILSLEKQIGFSLFTRTNQGARLTPEGLNFVELANRVLNDIENIPNLVQEKSHQVFRVGTMFTHAAISQAFTNLCVEYQDRPNINLTYYSSTSQAIVDDVYRNHCNLGLIFADSTAYNSYNNLIQGKNLIFKPLVNFDINVNLREGHPLLKEKVFDFNKLKNYPYVNYNYSEQSLYNVTTAFPALTSGGFIDTRKMIFVDYPDIRMQVIAATNAFAMGVSFDKWPQSHYKIKSIPLADIKMTLALVIKDNHTESTEEKKFLELLDNELAIFASSDKPYF